MHEGSIDALIEAMNERRKWEERLLKLEREINKLPTEERDEKMNDLEEIKLQLTYYDELIRKMKKDIKPTTLYTFIKSL